MPRLCSPDNVSLRRARSILNRLLTPSRLKENEGFMWRLADRQLDEFLANGECEFVSEHAKPFATLAITDLLGVPEQDHHVYRARAARPRSCSSPSSTAASPPAPVGSNARHHRSISLLTRSAERRSLRSQNDLRNTGELTHHLHRRRSAPRHRRPTQRLSR
jgi:cytochrome P450